MAVDGICGRRRRKREESRDEAPHSALSVENEQADAGRDGRTRLARPNYQALTGAGKYSEIFIIPVQLTTSRIGNHTRLIHTWYSAESASLYNY